MEYTELNPELLDQIKKVISGESEKVTIQINQPRSVLSDWVAENIGAEKVKENLFFLTAAKDKKDWPELKADFICRVIITRTENRFKPYEKELFDFKL